MVAINTKSDNIGTMIIIIDLECIHQSNIIKYKNLIKKMNNQILSIQLNLESWCLT